MNFLAATHGEQNSNDHPCHGRVAASEVLCPLGNDLALLAHCRVSLSLEAGAIHPANSRPVAISAGVGGATQIAAAVPRYGRREEKQRHGGILQHGPARVVGDLQLRTENANAGIIRHMQAGRGVPGDGGGAYAMVAPWARLTPAGTAQQMKSPEPFCVMVGPSDPPAVAKMLPLLARRRTPSRELP